MHFQYDAEADLLFVKTTFRVFIHLKTFTSFDKTENEAKEYYSHFFLSIYHQPPDNGEFLYLAFFLLNCTCNLYIYELEQLAYSDNRFGLISISID